MNCNRARGSSCEWITDHKTHMSVSEIITIQRFDLDLLPPEQTLITVILKALNKPALHQQMHLSALMPMWRARSCGVYHYRLMKIKRMHVRHLPGRRLSWHSRGWCQRRRHEAAHLLPAWGHPYDQPTTKCHMWRITTFPSGSRIDTHPLALTLILSHRHSSSRIDTHPLALTLILK